jgi:hypothetical protein
VNEEPERAEIPHGVLGAVLGAALTAPALMLAVGSAGAGHGAYVAARWLYPWPMLSSLATDDRLSDFAIVAAVLQFPVMGVWLGLRWRRDRWRVLGVLVALQLVGVVLAFAGLLPNFS